jgi:L-2-hydroxyglutarate oxidase LhgO
MDKIETVIIGAGVVGLAIAYQLAKQGREVLVLEQHDSFGQETSSRNSEVIHAGIYYPKDSLKSALCLKGNKLLYQFCQEHGVKHQRIGKIIVATNEHEEGQIDQIYANATALGVPDLKLLSKEEIKEIEPNIFALKGIYSGSTGIVDSHGLMKTLHSLAEKAGVMFVFGTEVREVASSKASPRGYNECSAREEQGTRFVITDVKGESIYADKVINCAGLNADKIAKMVGVNDYQLYYCKGDYFAISGSGGKLNHLVYPVPHEKGYGLGVHATLDLEGQIRLGPDTTYVDKIFYDVDPAKRNEFFKAAKIYLPWLKEEMIHPDTAGMRPKLQGPDDDFKDFVIQDEVNKGYAGFINLIGIESPGLTSCLAIGEMVGNLV